jgi:hypothetical protein
MKQDRYEWHSPPANASFLEKDSFRIKAPAAAVHMGARNVKTVASDKDRYCKE